MAACASVSFPVPPTPSSPIAWCPQTLFRIQGLGFLVLPIQSLITQTQSTLVQARPGPARLSYKRSLGVKGSLTAAWEGVGGRGRRDWE